MNIGSLSASSYRYINQIYSSKVNIEKSYEKISTGKAVNRASDNPLAINTISRYESQIRGTQAAINNIQDGITYLDIKDKALEHVQNIGKELKSMAVKYHNDFLTDEEKTMMLYSATELLKEINHVFNTTQYKGKNVFESDDITIQTGAFSSELFTIKQIEQQTLPEDNLDLSVYNSETNYKEVGTSGTNETHGTAPVNGSSSSSGGTQNIQSQDSNVVVSDLLGLGSIVGGVVDLVGGLLGLGGNKNKNNNNQSGGNQNSSNQGQNTPVNPTSENTTPPAVNGEDGNYDTGDENQIASFLNTNYIDEALLNPIATARAMTGVQRNILSSRFEYQTSMEEIMRESLGRIQDVDIAKEYMNIAKNEMLMNNNLLLLHESLGDRRGMLLNLLY